MRILVPVFVLLAALPASADEIVLKNGDKLTGKIVGLAGGKLKIETAHSGVVTVDWAQVASLTTDGPVKVKTAAGERLEGRLTLQDGKLKVAPEGAVAPVEIEMAKAAAFNEPPVEWHGGVDLSGRSTDGNTHTAGVIIAAEGIRATEYNQITVRGVARYGEVEGVITERNSYGLGKYQHVLYADLYAYASEELFSDKFKDLTLRSVTSAGFGYTVVKSKPVDLAVEVGLAYTDNNYRENEDDEYLGGRVGWNARVAIPYVGLDLMDSGAYYPNFEDGGDWTLHNEATVGTAIGGGWSLKAGMITDYDHEPFKGGGLKLRRHDNIYFIGLGYRF